MASLGMGTRSYGLAQKDVDRVVTKKSLGNYALGYLKDDKFVVKYVGRSDDDLNDRLKSWVGKGYDRFKCSYADSPVSAFKKECINYHDFGGSEKLDNKSHPDRPNGIQLKCPRCGQ